eukprot:TRINITY_DN4491_c0_g1_i1.p1 TRINITY_DN4491_c0_g1~~TRINITY_DN4491_c0_g1_i1.p1  ORF type:complete len:188 (+),score=44.83 TRINITY_DN4491_c0_g1_i1:47-565(+)
MNKRAGEALEEAFSSKKKKRSELDNPTLSLRILDEEWQCLEGESRDAKVLSACPKDRFSDVVPVRETLCVLEGGSYINANRVQLDGISFIATQEPLNEQAIKYAPNLIATENDFWSLVWEQKVGIIVSLTGTELTYLPSKKQSYGNLQVQPQEDKWIAGIVKEKRIGGIRKS